MRKSARLDQILLRLGAADQDQITRALQRQSSYGGLLGQNLVALGAITEEQLLAALSEQLGIPVLQPDEGRIVKDLLEQMPEGSMHDGLVLPLEWNAESRVLSVVSANPADVRVMKGVQDAFGARAMRVALAGEGAMRELVRKLAPVDGGEPGSSRVTLPELFARESDDEGPRPGRGRDPARRVLLVSSVPSRRNFLPPLLSREGIELRVAATRQEVESALASAEGPDAVLVSSEMRTAFAEWLREEGFPRPRCQINVVDAVGDALLDNPLPYTAVGASLRNAVQALADARCAQAGASPPYGLISTDVEALADRRGLQRVARDGLQLALHLLLPTELQGPEAINSPEPFAGFASSLELASRIRFPWKLDTLLAACHHLYTGRTEPGSGAGTFGRDTLLAAQILALVWYRHNHVGTADGSAEEQMIALRTSLRDVAGRLATRDLVEGYLRLIEERGGIREEPGERRVLLVGDERIERSLGPALSRVGREVLVSGDLADAQTLTERRPPAAIVVDHDHFPGQVDKFSRVTKLGASVLLFVLTDSSDPSLVLNLLDVGVDDVFGPPHEFDLVAARINRAIRSRSRVGAAERPAAGQFSATFEVFSFLDLVQMLSQARKSVRIHLIRGDEEATVFMRAGQMVHATLGDLRGEEAVHRVIAWEDQGQFTVREESRFPAATIHVASESVLMEGCRLLDESRRGV